MHTDDNIKRGYETQDAPSAPVFISLVVLVMLMIGGFVGGRFFLDIFTALEVNSRPHVVNAAVQPPLSKSGKERATSSVPGPLLQAYPSLDMYNYRKSEEDKLGSYGWISKEQGVVRIPIDLAMELAVKGHVPSLKGSSGH